MNVMKVDEGVYQLGKDMVWSGPSTELVEIFNEETEAILANIGPSDGFPRQVVFLAMVELARAKILINDEEPTVSGRSY